MPSALLHKLCNDRNEQIYSVPLITVDFSFLSKLSAILVLEAYDPFIFLAFFYAMKMPRIH